MRRLIDWFKQPATSNEIWFGFVGAPIIVWLIVANYLAATR